MTLRKMKLPQLIFLIFWLLHSQCVIHPNRFLFDLEVNYPQHEMLTFCQQELLNISFVKRKTFSYSPSLFYPLEHIYFSCPLSQFEKAGNSIDRSWYNLHLCSPP